MNSVSTLGYALSASKTAHDNHFLDWEAEHEREGRSRSWMKCRRPGGAIDNVQTTMNTGKLFTRKGVSLGDVPDRHAFDAQHIKRLTRRSSSAFCAAARSSTTCWPPRNGAATPDNGRRACRAARGQHRGRTHNRDPPAVGRTPTPVKAATDQSVPRRLPSARRPTLRRAPHAPPCP